MMNITPTPDVTTVLPAATSGADMERAWRMARRRSTDAGVVTFDLLNDVDYNRVARIIEGWSMRRNVNVDSADAVANMLAYRLELHGHDACNATSIIITLREVLREAATLIRQARYWRDRLMSLETMHYQSGWDTPADSVYQNVETHVMLRETLNEIPLRVRRYVVRRDSELQCAERDARYYRRWIEKQRRLAAEAHDARMIARKQVSEAHNRLRDSAVVWYARQSHVSVETQRDMYVVACRADWTRINNSTDARLYIAQLWAEYKRSVKRKVKQAEGRYNEDF